VTLVRNMWGAPTHLAYRAAVERGDIAGPRLVTTSPLVDGADERGRTIWPGSPRLTDITQARPLVRQYADQGYQQVKVYSWLTLEALQAVCTAAAEAGLRVTGHCPDGVSFEESIGAGMFCFEHLAGIGHGHLQAGFELPGLRLAADKPEARGAYTRMLTEHIDLDAIHRLASTMAARQIWSCPTNVVYQGFGQRRADVLSDPDLKYVLEPTVRRWAPRNEEFAGWSEERRSQVRAVFQANAELHVKLTGILHAEGAPILLGTDTPNPFVLQGFSIHDELRNLVWAGLSPYAAIRSGTIEAARFLGESDNWGTIQPGRRADALLLSADPLQGVDALQKLEAVFVNGFMLSRSDLDRLLAERLTAIRPGS
jgi:hypothetical protein